MQSNDNTVIEGLGALNNTKIQLGFTDDTVIEGGRSLGTTVLGKTVMMDQTEMFGEARQEETVMVPK